MISQEETIYYVAFGLACLALSVFYIRLKAGQGTVITTKEFQVFQTTFISGYGVVILAELVASATFYHTLMRLELSLNHIVRLYLAGVISSSVSSTLLEVIDMASRKNKCILCALLYLTALFSLFFGGHYEMLVIGRILYGAASALQHSAFEAYLLQQHASQGFPEDWLSQTFQMLTHAMALTSALSGVLGQSAAETGKLGTVGLCCALFAGAAAYLLVVWEKDSHAPRFMLSGFYGHMQQALGGLKANRQLQYVLAISTLFETSITMFSFFWAPWLGGMSNQALPYELIFSVLVCCSILGSYLQSLLGGAGVAAEQQFSGVLLGSSVCYGLALTLATPWACFVLGCCVQGLWGLYFPLMGQYRGRLVPHEHRACTLLLPKLAATLLSTVLLAATAHAPLLFMAACAALTGAAGYIQHSLLDKSLLTVEDLEDDEEDTL